MVVCVCVFVCVWWVLETYRSPHIPMPLSSSSDERSSAAKVCADDSEGEHEVGGVSLKRLLFCCEALFLLSPTL